MAIGRLPFYYCLFKYSPAREPVGYTGPMEKKYKLPELLAFKKMIKQFARFVFFLVARSGATTRNISRRNHTFNNNN